MRFISSSVLPEIILIEPRILGDERGFFMETYREEEYGKAGIPNNFVQDNHSGSSQGILRGLHYQIRQTQGKLIRVISGEVFDVVLDIRRSSSNFGKWEGTYLSAENKRQVWIPPGFAHGFYVVSEWAEVVYKATDYYAPQWERTILWNDPQIGIKWPLVDGRPPSLSSKDAQGQLLSQADLFN